MMWRKEWGLRDGASEGIRTLDTHVGNVMLYQAELRSLPESSLTLRFSRRKASPSLGQFYRQLAPVAVAPNIYSFRAVARSCKFAVSHPVNEINHDANHEPDKQSPPGGPGKRGHKCNCRQRTGRSYEPDRRRFEPAGQVGLTNSKNQNS